MNFPLAHWRAFRNWPSWGALDIFTEAEEEYLDLLEGWRSDMEKVGKHRTYERPEVDADWARERRIAYFVSEKANAEKRLVNAKIEAGRAALRNDIISEVGSYMDIADAKREIEKCANAVKYLSQPAEREGQITEAMIEQARRYPISRLVGNEETRIACQFCKNDRNDSATIKGNFFYCFACQTRLDSIGWLMRVNGYSFPQAVNALQGA